MFVGQTVAKKAGKIVFKVKVFGKKKSEVVSKIGGIKALIGGAFTLETNIWQEV